MLILACSPSKLLAALFSMFYAARLLEVESELHSHQLALSQEQRSRAAAEGEAESLRTQNEAKGRSLEEALRQLHTLMEERSSGESALDRRKMGMEQLTVEVGLG